VDLLAGWIKAAASDCKPHGCNGGGGSIRSENYQASGEQDAS
jgi:hypothetical protein